MKDYLLQPPFPLLDLYRFMLGSLSSNLHGYLRTCSSRRCFHKSVSPFSYGTNTSCHRSAGINLPVHSILVEHKFLSHVERLHPAVFGVFRFFFPFLQNNALLVVAETIFDKARL